MVINVLPPDLYPLIDWQHKLHDQITPVVFVSALLTSLEELICSNSEILCLGFTARNQNSEIFAVDHWIWFVFLFSWWWFQHAHLFSSSSEHVRQVKPDNPEWRLSLFTSLFNNTYWRYLLCRWTKKWVIKCIYFLHLIIVTTHAVKSIYIFKWWLLGVLHLFNIFIQ